MGDMADYYDDRFDERYDYEADRDREREERMKQKSFNDAVKLEVAKQLKRAGLVIKPHIPRGKMIDRVCKCGCGKNFQAREADVNRGWGRFSSKSCAATFKYNKSGGRYRSYYGS